MEARFRASLAVLLTTPLAIFTAAGAQPSAIPSDRLDVTGVDDYAPLLHWDLTPTEDGRSCRGWSSIKSPILPPGIDAWEAHVDWTACAPTVTYVAIEAPMALTAPPARAPEVMSSGWVTTHDTMTTSTGSEHTVANVRYVYDSSSAYVDSVGGWCRAYGGWRNSACRPDVWNTGPYEPRAAMLGDYYSVYWPTDPHSRYAVAGAYPGGGIQGECQEHGDLPWFRSTRCETARGREDPPA